ncbi:hypothetical protein [Bacillus thuringiensis]|uniref:hypothetical protein n=1 Tax=Bacillus thuringiensis TaxID=1428 RepID=UPI0026E2299D|nr:hypothetical protein [Bacillus thuringiensis]MDO6628723.1 hypothetical protein [Bacillus thuringiensis]MDO6659152.1 hypothetical protein [Bacillus thuringiensis]MDO6698938.1 hypothetical protein [Bacillus thuringiensis]
MKNFEIAITDTRTGETINLTADDLVLHLGRDSGDNQLIAMGCMDFVNMLADKEMLGAEAIDTIFATHLREMYESSENQSQAQVVEMKDFPRKRDA